MSVDSSAWTGRGVAAAPLNATEMKMQHDRMVTHIAKLKNDHLESMVYGSSTPTPAGSSFSPLAQAVYHGTKTYSSGELEKMISMRLRSARESFFQHWHCHKINDEKVVILVINNGTHVVLEDPWPLFPSDTLITQLRLLEK